MKLALHYAGYVVDLRSMEACEAVDELNSAWLSLETRKGFESKESRKALETG